MWAPFEEVGERIELSAGFAVLAIGILVALSMAAISMAAETRVGPVDPDTEKHRLVRFVSRFPRFARFVRRRLDRSTAGGLLLTVGFVVVLFLAVFVGWIFDTVDQESGFARFDMAVAEFGAGHADSFWWSVQGLFTRLGGTLVIAAVAIAVGLWGWWRYRNHHFALFMVSIAVGQALLNSGLKLLVGRERPDVLQLASFSGTSFPSGHSAAAAATYMAAAFVIAMGLRRNQRLVVVAMGSFVAAAVGASRALLGVHWLTDVLAGLAVGFAWFVVCAVAFGGRIMWFGEPKYEVEDRAETLA